MGDSRAMAGPDRLPWLTDEPRRRKQGKRDRAAWALAGALIVAGLSIWIPSAIPTYRQAEPAKPAAPEVSVPLPEPRLAPVSQVRPEPQPQVAPAPVHEIRPAPMREVHIAPSPRPLARQAAPESKPATTEKPEVVEKEAAASAPAPAAIAPPPAQLRPWPPRITAGAAGRLTQVGAFGSRLQAKRGWWAMVRAYPAMQRLPAVVVETRNSRGRHFYRFQVGTTSQAHSEVLCQRMQKIHLSCAVVGLPWKAKVER